VHQQSVLIRAYGASTATVEKYIRQSMFAYLLSQEQCALLKLMQMPLRRDPSKMLPKKEDERDA